MITKEESGRYVEAQKCEGCIGWHKYCQAECCKMVTIFVDPKKLGGGTTHLTIKPNRKLSISDIRYYQLRDVNHTRGCLRFKKDRIIVVGNKLIYYYPCKLLENNLCKGHPTDKPEICQIFNEENAKSGGTGALMTDNCLFKYK